MHKFLYKPATSYKINIAPSWSHFSALTVCNMLQLRAQHPCLHNVATVLTSPPLLFCRHFLFSQISSFIVLKLCYLFAVAAFFVWCTISSQMVSTFEKKYIQPKVWPELDFLRSLTQTGWPVLVDLYWVRDRWVIGWMQLVTLIKLN